MSPTLTPDLEARQTLRQCLVWLDSIGAAAGATHPLEASLRQGSGVEAFIALIGGQVFFVECLASRQVHHRKSHEHQRARFTVQRAHCLSVRSARELESLLRDHFHPQSV